MRHQTKEHARHQRDVNGGCVNANDVDVAGACGGGVVGRRNDPDLVVIPSAPSVREWMVVMVVEVVVVGSQFALS